MKITVAIPTIAGRSKYLRWAIQTCVSQDHDFEILVSDNSPGDAREVVESFGDRRIRYVRPPAYLSMSAHWDFVLTQGTGDFLTIIGDDDGLMPNCVRRVTEIHQNAAGDLPIHHSLGNYCWPDFPDEGTRHTFSFLHSPGRGINEVNSRAFLKAVARSHARYLDGPMVYHNFVPTSLLRRLTHEGVFFRRASPDMYSSLAVAANVPRYISTEEVLTITGQGAKSNGAAVRGGGGNEFVAEMEAFYAPRFDSRTVQLHLLDCLIEVAEHFNRPELLADVHHVEHIAQAISEARGMQPPLRGQEVRKAIAVAQRQGITAAVGLAIVRRKVAYIARRASGPLKLGQGLAPGHTIKLDPDCIQNIFDATVFVHRMLTEPA